MANSSLLRDIAYYFPDVPESVFKFSSPNLSIYEKLEEIRIYLGRFNMLPTSDGYLNIKLYLLFLQGELDSDFMVKEAYVNKTFLNTNYVSYFTSKDFYFKSINEFHDTMFKLFEAYNKLALSNENIYNYKKDIVLPAEYVDGYYFKNYLEKGRYIYSSYDSDRDTFLCIVSEIIRYMVYHSYYFRYNTFT